MTGCKNKEELNVNVPVYTTLANAETSARLSLFQAAIDALLDMQKIEGFSVMITMAMFNSMLTMTRGATSVDSTEAG